MIIHPEKIVNKLDILNSDFSNCYENAKFDCLESIINEFSEEKNLNGAKWQLEKDYFNNTYIDIFKRIIQFNNNLVARINEVITLYNKYTDNESFNTSEYDSKNELLSFLKNNNGSSTDDGVTIDNNSKIEELTKYINELNEIINLENTSSNQFEILYGTLKSIIDDFDSLVASNKVNFGPTLPEWSGIDLIDKSESFDNNSVLTNASNVANNKVNFGPTLPEWSGIDLIDKSESFRSNSVLTNTSNVIIGSSINPNIGYTNVYDVKNNTNSVNLNKKYINSDNSVISGFCYIKDDGTLIRSGDDIKTLKDFISTYDISESDASKISILVSDKNGTAQAYVSVSDMLNDDSISNDNTNETFDNSENAKTSSDEVVVSDDVSDTSTGDAVADSVTTSNVNDLETAFSNLQTNSAFDVYINNDKFITQNVSSFTAFKGEAVKPFIETDDIKEYIDDCIKDGYTPVVSYIVTSDYRQESKYAYYDVNDQHFHTYSF